MCNLSEAAKETVSEAIIAHLQRKAPFTGYEVAAALNESGAILDNKEVSAYVRELFNKGKFSAKVQWASTQVTPGTGPVLYFVVAPASTAGKASKAIRVKLALKP